MFSPAFPADPASTPQWRPARLWWLLRFALVVGALFVLLAFALSSADPAWRSPSGWLRALRSCLIFSITISLTIEALYIVVRRGLGAWLLRGPDLRRRLYYAFTPFVGVLIGLTISNLIVGWIGGKGGDATAAALSFAPLGAVAFLLLLFVLFYGYYWLLLRKQRAERAALEAQLKLLQGQIEPHFLFNTLANVVGLMDHDTPRAKMMLESFVDYLRSSFRGMRQEHPTLGHELDLVEAYLRILKIRMDDRLAVHIDVSPELRTLPLLPLTLQPLVENAVQHGLEPKIEGGSLWIAARVEGQGSRRVLTLSVTDDGLGLPAAGEARRNGGNGSALANIRERLAQVHPGAAALRVEPHAPHGVRATLTLPV